MNNTDNKNRIKLREAILMEELTGRVIVKGELALILFPSDSPYSSKVSFWKYLKGTSFKVDREMIDRICLELNTSPDFLFGYKE